MDKYLVCFSGGKDSTAMLLRLIAEKQPIDCVLCVDTTKEFPAMYDHINRVKTIVDKHSIEFITIKIHFDYYFADHIKTKGKNKGKRGYGWPDFRNRWCTALKRQAINKWKKDNLSRFNVIEYHGISVEEPNRLNKNKDGRTIKTPLIEWNMTGEDCIQYCYDRDFNWDGLYETMHRVSCYCCPLSRIGELKQVYDNYPELWQDMKAMDLRSFRNFRSDYTLTELEIKFSR